MAGEAVLGAGSPGASGPMAALSTVGSILREGAAAILDAATDKSTVEALDELAGPRWRLAAQAADIAVVAAQAAVNGAGGSDLDGPGATGEPLSEDPETAAPKQDTEDRETDKAPTPLA
jgi:hypothetical protein